MTHLVPGRQTVTRDDGIVVFLIGARVNKWWLLPFALPVLLAMPKMLKELLRDPDSGLLGVQPLGLGGMVQYWRSADDLVRYANDRSRTHRPTARRFFQKIFKSRALGVWHELYVVPRGHYETLYINMPRFGLGQLGPLVEARGELATTRHRLAPECFRTDVSRRSASHPLGAAL